MIDGAPALAHAVDVALALGRHVPDAAPELVAAVLLHDSPEFAPSDIGLDTTLTTRLGAEVTRVVRAMEREHIVMAERAVPDVGTGDLWVTWASAADKLVSLRSILRRAARSADQAAYWRTRTAFVARVPYFRAFHTRTAPHLPARMSEELERLVTRAERTTGRA
ncbi:metal-dependent phosphohydrolase [Planosporangium flavigriseum]|uniref:HD domain-containing protein n=1 Tax=Planosporangium flavigriseum TaxID=373681 RepID=A0A8J3PM17_9ACTN|nr:metal-dependent phosphohydrolase [Planosporangium flavigriseum]NJC66044.1 metal-dependent phosphohydrolase [Planosporangium flavigriseum]GIG75076.1 hypothetical protein Pfl04_34800 [Planosporangium flavigriseum]